MKFMRLDVLNYRGIESESLEFDPEGITLVVGPNEAGKSSLGQAILDLFETRSSTKGKEMASAQPIGRDVAPEITLHAETGPYSFSYYKRYLKSEQTTLRIEKPRLENLTGKDAHIRAEEILRETVDVALWKALNLWQGEGIFQPDLTKSESLLSVLDRSSGGRPVDAANSDLFRRVGDEYARFFTSTGKDNQSFVKAKKSADDARQEVDELTVQVKRVDVIAARAADVRSELNDCLRVEKEIAERLAGTSATMRQIDDAERKVQDCHGAFEAAARTLEYADRDWRERENLIAESRDASRNLGLLQTALLGMDKPLKDAEALFKAAQGVASAAGEKRTAAMHLADLCRKDFDYLRGCADREDLSGRLARIESLRQKSAQAEKDLARNAVDAATLESIEKAERKWAEAGARREVGAPKLLLRALADCAVEVNGESARLSSGEEQRRSVVETMRVVVPGQLEIEVEAGGGSEKLLAEEFRAREILDAALRNAGVADLAAARTAFEERRDAQRILDDQHRSEKDVLRGLSYDELRGKVEALDSTIPGYLQTRQPEPPICQDVSQAEQCSAEAEDARRAAEDEYAEAVQKLEEARSAHTKLKDNASEADIQFRAASMANRQCEEKLAAARVRASDESLFARLEEKRNAAMQADTMFAEARNALTALDPDRVKSLNQTDEDSLGREQRRRRELKERLAGISGELKVLTEGGLHQRLQEAEERLESIEAENRSLCRRAAAAKKLYEVLSEERTRLQISYAEPLREKVDKYGKLVFSPSFGVAIDENLSISHRIQGQDVLPFDSLSGGAREQLSLLLRLACSSLAAADGGIPLILDDALGYTDPERLRLMGAVLASAAREKQQIIIFTCMPDRYRDIGAAKVVTLRKTQK